MIRKEQVLDTNHQKYSRIIPIFFTVIVMLAFFTTIPDSLAADTESAGLLGDEAPDGLRLMAAQCFQCHGTGGRSTTNTPTLNGQPENVLIAKLMGRRASADKSDLMHFQANGYTEAELSAIAYYISTLKQ